MKSYLLRNSKTVEPQNPRPALAPASARGPALFIGLDVHNDSIAVSIAPGDSTEVRRYGIIGGTTTTCSARWMDEGGRQKTENGRRRAKEIESWRLKVE